ncbi:MAG: hypothetical protein GY951_02335 [Psychromonas sp.]|nr:hypothetical protein [Psychromonas sp.]
MRISDSNIQLWSNSEKNSIKTQLTNRTTTEIQETDPDRRTIGWQQELNLTYNARYIAKKQLQSNSISEVTSSDNQSTTRISNEQAVSEILSGVLSKDITLFNSQFSLSDGSELSDRSRGNKQLVTAMNNHLAVTTDESVANELTQPITGQLSMQFEAYELLQESEEMQVRAMGQVKLEDGRSIDFALELKMQRSFELEQNLTSNISLRTLKDPLVINLSGAPVELTESSFQFDIDSDGQQDEISFVRPGSGLLVLDINKDGVINNGSELFGANSGQGFAELAEHDNDGNLWIDENDPVFENLQVWSKDAQGNDTLISLKESGVGAIYLGSTESEFDLTDGQNQLLGKIQRSGVFLKESGEVSSIQQIDLAKHDSPPSEPQLDNTFSQLAEQFNGSTAVQNSNSTQPLLQLEMNDNILLDNSSTIVVTNNDAETVQPINEVIEKAQKIVSMQEVKTETIDSKKPKEEDKQAIVEPRKEELSYASQDAIDRLNSLSNSLSNYKQEQQIKMDRLNSLLDSLKDSRRIMEEYRHNKSHAYEEMTKPIDD